MLIATWVVRPFSICTRTNYSLLPLAMSGSASLDLSGALKLRDVTLRLNSVSVEWVTATLQTITSKSRDLQQISIYVPYYLTYVGDDIRQTVADRFLREWWDLDRLLAQFWEYRSIRPMVMRPMPDEEELEERDFLEGLLPETTGRGIVDLVVAH